MAGNAIAESVQIEVYDGREDAALHLKDMEGSAYQLQTLDHPEGNYMFTVWAKPVSNMTLIINSLGHLEIFDMSSEDGWRKLQVYTETPTTDVVEFIALRSDRNIVDEIYLYKGMLELSTNASDWTPAPEEVDENIEFVTNEIETTKSTILEQLDNQISATVTQITTAYTNGIKTAKEELTGSLTVTNQNVAQVVKRINDVDGKLSEQRTWQRFDENGITMGKSENGVESPFQMTLSNEKLEFKEDGKPVSSISNKKMYISEAQITNMLRFGDFAFMPTSTGMALVYVGESGG